MNKHDFALEINWRTLNPTTQDVLDSPVIEIPEPSSLVMLLLVLATAALCAKRSATTQSDGQPDR